MKIMLDITSLAFISSGVKTISGDICKAFPALQSLEINKVYASNIAKDAFAKCTELLNLEMKNNYLTKLDETLFSKNTKLQDIDFSNNKLENFPAKFFDNLTNLKQLKLHDNKIFEFPVTSLAPSSKSLNVLCLAINPITDLDVNTLLADFPNLVVIHLKGTAIPEARLKEILKLLKKRHIVTDMDEETSLKKLLKLRKKRPKMSFE